jgi:hypothetical protein
LWRAVRCVKGLAMNGPTKTVGPPLTPLPASKTTGVSVRGSWSGKRNKEPIKKLLTQAALVRDVSESGFTPCNTKDNKWMVAKGRNNDLELKLRLDLGKADWDRIPAYSCLGAIDCRSAQCYDSPPHKPFVWFQMIAELMKSNLQCLVFGADCRWFGSGHVLAILEMIFFARVITLPCDASNQKRLGLCSPMAVWHAIAHALLPGFCVMLQANPRDGSVRAQEPG